MALLKRIFTLTLIAGSLSGAGSHLHAQAVPPEPPESAAASDGYKEPKRYTYVSQMPEFPGDVYAWIGAHVKYPEAARRRNIEGKAFISFIVNANGQVEQVKVARSSGDDLLDAEAVRVISSMPSWKPGRNNGTNINVSYNLPLTFTINK